VLALLEDHGATATFYMQGRHVEDHPDLVRAVAERHAVGNHSFNHPDLGAADEALARRELHDTHEVIRSVVGRVPDTFRPPYGGLSGATLLVAVDMGYQVILWSDRIASRSTVDHNLRSAGELRPGAVVVAHDGGRLPNQTVLDSLPGVLETISRRGFHLGTVADLLRL
jgi:peptidoglycan-N-acetylglucosamine deacetylase